ncbi:MAG: hypothetical protein ACYTHJ_10545 [Planctomycetota bacterium]|jgi:hypothetical protein
MSDDIASSCQQCGASVYKQHLESGIARYEAGRLLCAHCCAEYEKEHDAAGSGAFEEFETIALDGDDEVVASDMSQSRILTTEHNLGLAGGWDDSQYKRKLVSDQVGATRCRTFHSKLAESALQFMNRQINDWVDSDDKIVVKFTTSTIGVFEGKHPEPHLILTVFY